MSLAASSLTAGTPARAMDFPRSMQAIDRTTQLNVTSTSYATGSPEVAVRFLAPTSGRVAVTVAAGMRNNSATQDRCWVAFAIFEGDPNDGNQVVVEEVKYGVSNHAISDAADDYAYQSQTTIVRGLTPGTWYYARVRHKATTGTGSVDIAERQITVFPVP